jgi:hypothetical protein
LKKLLVEVEQALDAFPAQAQTGLGQANKGGLGGDKTKDEILVRTSEHGWQLGLKKLLVEVVQALDAFPAQA